MERHYLIHKSGPTLSLYRALESRKLRATQKLYETIVTIMERSVAPMSFGSICLATERHYKRLKPRNASIRLVLDFLEDQGLVCKDGNKWKKSIDPMHDKAHEIWESHRTTKKVKTKKSLQEIKLLMSKLPEGMILPDIARRLDISEGNAYRWCRLSGYKFTKRKRGPLPAR